tara:strand:+ start:130 stop:345 length:216 start_codon:yes stop_codon:yes gene_type:complete
MTNEEQIKEVKRVAPIVDQIASKKKLGWDFGYLYNATPPYWECELLNEQGKTVEYYKASTTKKLIRKMRAA